MAFAPIKRWKLPYITRWESFQNRNPPIISADEVLFVTGFILLDGPIPASWPPSESSFFRQTAWAWLLWSAGRVLMWHAWDSQAATRSHRRARVLRRRAG